MDQRRALLEAAITCLQQRGYARTTTRDIVAAAGAHLPAVNYYFGSKERLLAAAIVEALRRWAQATMDVANDPAIPGRQRLHRALDSFLGSLDANRAYVVAAMEAFTQAPRNDELRGRLAEEYQRARDEIAADVVAVAKDEGEELGDAEADSLASVLLALFDGLAIQWLMDPGRVPDADRAVRSLQLLASAVTP